MSFCLAKIRGTSSIWFKVAVVLTTSAAIGCRTHQHVPDHQVVSNRLLDRFGQTVPTPMATCPTGEPQIVFPPGAAFDDGLTEDEAISIALWNNAAFHELLVDLGVARGDLIQAGLLPNPEFVYFVPVSDKPYKYLFDVPIEAVWLRPIRVAAAAREVERVSGRLTQAGLDLIRDVRQAYADLTLAHARVRIANEAVKLRGRIAEFAAKRLDAGDISPQEAATARIDSLTARQDLTRVGFDIPILEERLRNLMGTSPLRTPLRLDPSAPPIHSTFDADGLAYEACLTRPDAVAAAEAVKAAEARLKFAQIGWVRVLGLADATSGTNGHQLGPAFRITLPIFNRNEGAIARAEAELERTLRNQKTVQYQILLDVHRAHYQFEQATAEIDVVLTKIRPEVETAIRRAQAAYANGNVTIFVVLETTRQLLDNYLREAQLNADLLRFWAELERSVGRRLAAGSPTDVPGVPELPAPSESLPEPTPAVSLELYQPVSHDPEAITSPDELSAMEPVGRAWTTSPTDRIPTAVDATETFVGASRDQ